jgi:hypothetical protein
MPLYTTFQLFGAVEVEPENGHSSSEAANGSLRPVADIHRYDIRTA